MVQKRGVSPSSSPMTRERRQAMASNTVKKDEDSASVESNSAVETKTEKTSPTTDDKDKVKDEFVQLGRDLNMDTSTSNAAWSSYDAIKQNYTLEVSEKPHMNSRLSKVI